MSRLCAIAGTIVVLTILMLPGATAAGAVQPINFVRGTLAGAGFTTTNPSSLAVGPDGRVYVADTNGSIRALTLDPNTKAVTAVQQITTDADIQEILGIAFDPADTSSPPPIYISNTISGFGDAGQAPAGAFSGKVTKISGAAYATRADIITGLPVSNSGHETNGLAFGPDGNIYVTSSGSTGGVLRYSGTTGSFLNAFVPPGGDLFLPRELVFGPDGNLLQLYAPPK